jgi:WD40 repeat protein
MLVLEGRVGSVEALGFSPNGRWLAAGGTRAGPEVWDLARAGGPAAHRAPIGKIRLVRFDPLRARLYILFSTQLVATFDYTAEPRGCDPIHNVGNWPSHNGGNWMDVSDDGRTLVIAGRATLTETGTRLKAFDAADPDRLQLTWADTPTTDGRLHWGVCWLPGTRRFAASEWVGRYPDDTARIVIRDADTGELLQKCPRPGRPTDQLAASSDGTLLAASKMLLTVWPGSDLGRDPRVVTNDNRKHFTGVAFHPSGRYLAATSNDETVKLYDTATWQLAKTFTWQVGRLRSVAFSPDGTRAAVGSDTGKIVVWDVDL